MIPFLKFDKIQIGPVAIYVWGLFLVLGILFAFFYSLKSAKRKNIDTNIIIDAFFWLLVGLIIGARLGHIFQSADYYFQNPIDILKVWKGGMAFHGGLIGLLIAGIIFAWTKKVSREMFFRVADIIALPAPLGITIGRIGCSLINDHQGTQTGLPWGIIWPNGIVRHPVAEYLIITNILIFLILRYFYTKPNLAQKPGRLFWNFLFLYSISRFFLDFTRSVGTPLSDPRYFNLSTAQWLSLAVILGIMVKSLMFLIINRKAKFLVPLFVLAVLIFLGASCTEENNSISGECYDEEYGCKILTEKEIEEVLLKAGEKLGWGGVKVQSSKLGHFIKLDGEEGNFKAKLQISDISDFLGTQVEGLGIITKDNYLEKICKVSEKDFEGKITEVSGVKICYIINQYQKTYIFDNIANAIMGNYQLIAESQHDHGGALNAKEIIVPLIEETIKVLK